MPSQYPNISKDQLQCQTTEEDFNNWQGRSPTRLESSKLISQIFNFILPFYLHHVLPDKEFVTNEFYYVTDSMYHAQHCIRRIIQSSHDISAAAVHIWKPRNHKVRTHSRGIQFVFHPAIMNFQCERCTKRSKITKYIPESSPFSSSGVSDIGTHPCDKSYHCPTEGHRNTGKQEVCWFQTRYNTQKSIYCIHKTISCKDK